MKLKFKSLALVVALAATGLARADLTPGNVGNSSLSIVAFNQVTQSYYVRDLGIRFNDFLPNQVTTAAGDGAVTGNRTPEAGLNLDKTNVSSFSDGLFATWVSQQTNASDIRWTVAAGDSQSLAGTNNVSRMLVAMSQPPSIGVSNGTLTNGVVGVNQIATAANPIGLSGIYTASLPTPYLTNLVNDPTTLNTLDVASGLYYLARTQGTLANSTVIPAVQYGNSGGFASVLLKSNGDFSYTLAPVSAVPVPAAAWLMGSGLMAIGGMIRRRRAAAAAA